MLRRSGPMNVERAQEIMAQFELDGLVLSEPLNLFHALGYWPQIALTKAGQPPTSFVLIARDAKMAPGFVTTRFIYYYTFADSGFRSDLRVYLANTPEDDGSVALVPAAATLMPDLGDAPLSPLEARRQTAWDVASHARASHQYMGAALAAAMRDMGMWHGRVAIDHPVIEAVCARHEHPGTRVAADNIMRWIRLVKSPVEIALMRRAAIANAAAVHEVGRLVRAGASTADLRGGFDKAAAQRGNRSVFMTVDRASSELSDETVRDGQTLFIDGVSHYLHYHGDYARTVFVGEPRAPARRAVEAAAHGWQAIREILRPGLRFSEITAAGAEAVRRAGFNVTIGFGPHSVGLMHTDEPGEDRGGFYGKMDHVLRENMILSVDCPVMDTGWDGSAHLEDLMLITADGAEPIHPVADAVLVV